MIVIPVYGSRIDASITASRCDRNGQASRVGDITNIWDGIKDWLCGTRKEEARLALFHLTHEDSSAGDRFTAFEKLRTLVAEHFVGHFQYAAREDGSVAAFIKDGECEFDFVPSPDKSATSAFIGEGAATPRFDHDHQLRYLNGNNQVAVEDLEHLERALCDMNVVGDQRTRLIQLLCAAPMKDPRGETGGDKHSTDINLQKMDSGEIRVDVHHATLDFEARPVYEHSGDHVRNVLMGGTFLVGATQTICLKSEAEFTPPSA